MSIGFGVILAGLAVFGLVGMMVTTSAGAAAGEAGGSASAPSGSKPNTPTGPEKQQIREVAAEYGLSPQTLWGVFGTESDFGHNTSTSSAGAQGPFQFIPSTWAKYGYGGNVQNFSDALLGAANLLQSLGANSNPNSAQTVQALNNYNGNQGGTSLTSYVQSVLHYGLGF